MASRNVNTGPGFDLTEKLQSNTLKRQPNPDWSKTDLLRLLSYFEGELQARDVTIATLRAEKAKNLLFQAKYGRFGLGDPFIALQRDSENMKDNSFDEPAIKSMYDNQLAQLENLIATQRKAQLKMREQLASAEKRYHKVCAELEDEKRKHAQDTAQGDDVTYMLEKERERLKQEVDFEKGQNKRLEKDLKKTLASLEEERANSAKHKQVALMLIKERKKLVEKVFHEKHKSSQIEQILGDEKDKMMDMAEGLLQESKKSLKMEAAMEKQLSEFDVEREQLRNKLIREESRNKEMSTQIECLQLQVDSLQKQLHSVMERSASKDALQSIEIKSSVSPGRSGGSTSPGIANLGSKPVPKTVKPGSMESRIGTGSPDRDFSVRPADSGARKTLLHGSSPSDRVDSKGERVAPVGAANIDRSALEAIPGHRVSIPQGSSATVVAPSGGKISLHVGQGGGSPRKVAPAGRGAPPPIPPNKPILNPGTPGPKPTPPPKVGITISKDRISVSGAGGDSPGDVSSRTASPKSVQIPVNVVGGQSVATSGARQSSRDNSPMRKTTQSLASQALETAGVIPPAASTLDFLGPEMADLQQLLATMTTGETSPSDSSSVVNIIRSSHFETAAKDIRNSPVHKYAACGQLDALKMLILERDADVNLPMKDGTTPIHCAVEYGHDSCLNFLVEKGGNSNALRDDLFGPLHLAAETGHIGCVQILLSVGACVNIGNYMNCTPLHLAARRGHHSCCTLLLRYGAQPYAINASGLTPIHSAVQGGCVDCLQLLLKAGIQRQMNPSDKHLQGSVTQVVNAADKDGWTLAHMAASLESEDCLKLLTELIPLDLDRKDRFGRSAFAVASKRCKDFLNENGKRNTECVKAVVEICVPQRTSSDPVACFTIGTLEVTPELSWGTLEEKLTGVMENYFSMIDSGLRTRKINRLEPDSSTENTQYTLGLGKSSIKTFQMSYHQWPPGLKLDKMPYEILCNNDNRKISITLDDEGVGCEAVAFDTLYQIQVIQNYLRLLEQYKSVVFYGPGGSGKSYLTERLAHCIASRERLAGREPVIHHLSLTPGFSNADLLAFLKQKGCMVHARDSIHNKSPIVLMDDLEKINIAEIFGELLDPIEYRGKTYSFHLKGEVEPSDENYYLLDNFYLLATMNRTRSTGLDLGIQQRFRWVHFRLDAEPFKNNLARHMQRQLFHLYSGRLPTSNDPIFKCVEWVICISQRLNDSISKLGLPDVAFGPCLFIHCPLEKGQQAVLDWIRDIWNNIIAPQVREAVKRGTGSEAPTDGQQKVANTALYVLMQRSVVLGCPLTGKEKETYLSGFSGSNELDIPLRSDKRSSVVSQLTSRDSWSGTDNSFKDRHPRVEVFTSSGVKLRNKHRDESRFYTSLSNSKRRSLSESSVDKASKLDKDSPDGDPLASQPKMPKLEIRSPVLLSLSNSFRRQGTESENHSVPTRTSVSMLTGRTSPFHSGSPMATKKSRSSENISSSSASLRSPSPLNFSFSLTTPTSSLNSFKFLEVDPKSQQCSESNPDFNSEQTLFGSPVLKSSSSENIDYKKRKLREKKSMTCDGTISS